MMAAVTPKSGVVIPHQAKWYQRLAAGLIVFFIRIVALTIRFRLDDRSGYLRGNAPSKRFVFALWHNRLALAPILYHRYIRKYEPDRQMAGLVSASRDGGLLTQILKYFGVETARGSSSRRGGQALVELTTCAEEGYDLTITPDGPRGPRYDAQEGVITTAQVTGLPIVPFSYYLSWKIRLNSWDGFQIPLPFARCEAVVGKPIFVPREISDEQRESYRKQLEQVLKEITRD
ncbi:MAG TPA: lysophospholipid acyltransferase family protein [Candidatus Acidoferrales bacterium]|jgi:lysophospholipid acyltransferase (LPLAT)-like uncharacterized protein|nr:lysophospholipid acyltransferase family protein [Candidatus Acidoferrales bacterium]